MARGAVHPRVVAAQPRWRSGRPRRSTVVEVPLLYETGGDERFDNVVVITAPEALREARREPLPGDRETRLIDDKEKAKRADFAYVNIGLAGGNRPVRRVRRRRSDPARRLCGSCRWPPSPEWRRGFCSRRPSDRREDPAIRCATRRSSAATRGTTTWNPALLAAVIETESKFRADAKSPSGAIGVMQILPSTASRHRRPHGRLEASGTEDLYNPEINVRYGAWYLRHLLDKYDDAAHGARRLQRGPGQRRPLARPGGRASVTPRRERTSPGSRS